MLWKLARHCVAFWGERCKSNVALIHAQMLRKIHPDVLLLPNVSVTKIAVFQIQCFFLPLLQNLTRHGLPHLHCDYFQDLNNRLLLEASPFCYSFSSVQQSRKICSEDTFILWTLLCKFGDLRKYVCKSYIE